jgi:hypothetical protein
MGLLDLGAACGLLGREGSCQLHAPIEAQPGPRSFVVSLNNSHLSIRYRMSRPSRAAKVRKLL